MPFDSDEPENLFFWMAFNNLRGSRAVGMEAGRIPFSEIKAWCDSANITCPVMKSRVLRVVSELDLVELNHGRA